MAVVKANAYGHGDLELSRALNRFGVYSFAVATIDEGIGLRKGGIRGEILVLGYTDAERAGELHRYRLTQTIVDLAHASELNKRGIPLSTHLKVDTGMHRLGIDWQAMDDIRKVFRLRNLQIDGMFTHLCSADSQEMDDVRFTEEQVRRFTQLCGQLEQAGCALPRLHVHSSYGALNFTCESFTYARIGIALYGVWSSPGDNTRRRPSLRPVMTLQARIASVRQVAAGESVGYGRTFVASHQTGVAVVAIGYADGVPRALSRGRGRVLVHGCYAPIIGRICMDQLMVDVTGISDVQPGDIATLIGTDGTETIRAEEVADAAGTISNELLSRLGARLTRIYLEAHASCTKVV